jgi:nicotinamide phosphoribosyltransferase
MLDHLKPLNIILMSDGYKVNHYLQQKPDTTHSYVVIVPRRASSYADHIVAAGQAMLSSLLASVRITHDMIDEAEVEITEQGYIFNRAGWEYIVNELDGKLPLVIYGVEEGRVVAPQTPIVGIYNTDDECWWLPTYVETIAQSIMWTMSTTASLCRAARLKIAAFCEKTGTDVANVDYMLHNFGDRSANGPEAAVLTAISHAMLFNGSDCLAANSYIKKLYNTNKAYLSSIEATEHSTTASWSDAKTLNDRDAALMVVNRLLAVVKRHQETGLGLPFVSGVIDLYDSRRFVRDFWGDEFKSLIETSGGRLIGRPDSGDVTVEPGLVGLDFKNAFGGHANELGYWVLPSYVGVIQGDGCKIHTIDKIMQGWVDAGFSMDNFCLGMGDGISHHAARDDFSFSVKSIANQITDGTFRSLLKKPITDLAKSSLTGLMRCTEDGQGNLQVIDCSVDGVWKLFPTEGEPGWQLWFSNGNRKYRQTFDNVRVRARIV